MAAWLWPSIRNSLDYNVMKAVKKKANEMEAM
jgi:hypothetical protein